MIASYNYVANKANGLLWFSDNESSGPLQSSMTCAGISMPITKIFGSRNSPPDRLHTSESIQVSVVATLRRFLSSGRLIRAQIK